MLKKLKELLRRDPEQFRIPRSVQEVIPIRTVWKSGIFLVGPNRYSRTWQFSDINYALAGEEDQKSMLLGYSGLLNLCDSNASTKFSVVTRKLNRRDFEDYIMIPYANDGHDHYRREYNSLPNTQVQALLKSPSPLADVFAAWEDRETSYMEEIWQTVTGRAKEETQKFRNAQKER